MGVNRPVQDRVRSFEMLTVLIRRILLKN